MSENLPIAKPETDLSEKDLEKIKQFKAEGMPGLARLGEIDFHRMTELYFNGMTYWQISNHLNISRVIIMHLSHTYGWYPAKQEYLEELQEKIKSRTVASKVASQDFMLLMIQAYQKRLGQNMGKYLATDDGGHMDKIDLKEIDKLLKAIEILQTLNSDGKSSSKTPAVGLNLGDGVTIERSGDNKVTITPAADRQLSDILKKMADSRRDEQNKAAKSDKHDIDLKNDKKTKEEPENE